MRLTRPSFRHCFAILMAGLAFLAAAHPAGAAADSQTLSTLNVLPRIALVIGNSSYARGPLKNPVNDANAIAAQLTRTGFKVTLLKNAGKKEMDAAVASFSEELAGQKMVGLFYFAGHGMQLNWRNYLIPVDARILGPEDVQTQAVDVAAFLDNLRRAKNPMSVIILDACRNNPFGARKDDAKGLSQMDAPPGTLLAYATAPGNVAQDGDGANGLYTEHLLRQISVPEARIEDVFKKTRFGVRRDSTGQQLPWESTSLEEDFYFIPPRELLKQSAEEQDRQFKMELAIWEKTKNSREAGPLEDYLSRYPSGKFSELAQHRIERILAAASSKAIVLTSLAPTPFSKGTTRMTADFKVGDSYSYRKVDLLTKEELPAVVQTVTALTETEVIYNNGEAVTDAFGNFLLDPGTGYRYESSAQVLLPEYAIDKKTETSLYSESPAGERTRIHFASKIVRKETITIPAGTFEAFRIETEYFLDAQYGGTIVTWIAPDRVRRYLASEILTRNSKNNMIVRFQRLELTSFKENG
jgi:hypothetical protein